MVTGFPLSKGWRIVKSYFGFFYFSEVTVVEVGSARGLALMVATLAAVLPPRRTEAPLTPPLLQWSRKRCNNLRPS